MHFAIAYEVRPAGKLVAKPNNQEQRDTDVGCRYAAPVNGVSQECFIVLAQRNNQAQDEGKKSAPAGRTLNGMAGY